MEKKQNNKNSFLITWSSCIVVLLVLCFFGVSDTVKGTKAASCVAWTCSKGTPTGDGSKCIVMYTEKVWVSGATSSTTCSNPGFSNCCPSGTSSSCTRSTNGDSTVTTCKCKSTGQGFYKTVEKAKTIDATCIDSDTGKCPAPPTCSEGYHTEYNSQGCSVCVKDIINSGECPAPPTCSEGYHRAVGNDGCYTCMKNTCPAPPSCSDGYHVGIGEDGCFACINDDPNYNPGSCPSVVSCPNDSNKVLGEDGCYTCMKNTCPAPPSCSDGYHVGVGEDGCFACIKDTQNTTCEAGYYPTGNRGNCSICPINSWCDGKERHTCPTGTVAPSGSSSSSACKNSCSSGMQFSSLNSASYAAKTMCESQGKKALLPVSLSHMCYELSCCDCEGDECGDEDYYACWCDSSGTNCNWGYKSKNVGKVEGDNCDTGVPSDPDDPETPGNPEKPDDPEEPNNPENPDDPSDPTNPDDRGDGCYKNKDTGEFKWFEGDPELTSGTNNYEKVNDSNCKQNVTTNPQTGEIAIFLIFVLGFGAAGYSILYYIKCRKEN